MANHPLLRLIENERGLIVTTKAQPFLFYAVTPSVNLQIAPKGLAVCMTIVGGGGGLVVVEFDV